MVRKLNTLLTIEVFYMSTSELIQNHETTSAQNLKAKGESMATTL